MADTDKNIDGSLLDAIVTHPEHGKAKVINDTEGSLILSLVGSGKEIHNIPKSSVTVLSSAPISKDKKEDYSEYLTYASDEIKDMFNAFSPEDKKKYSEVVKHMPTQTEFHFDVKKRGVTVQKAIYRINKQRVNIPDEDLKAGIIEKYEESGYEGSEYFGNSVARSKYTPEGQGLTFTRFRAIVRAMPGSDYTGIGPEYSSVAIRQLFISLGGKWSECRQVDAKGVVMKKVQANNDDRGYKNVKGEKYPDTPEKDHPYVNPDFASGSYEREGTAPRIGYLALDGVDEHGNTLVISASKDGTDFPKGTINIVSKGNMYSRVTLAESPTITDIPTDTK